MKKVQIIAIALIAAIFFAGAAQAGNVYGSGFVTPPLVSDGNPATLEVHKEIGFDITSAMIIQYVIPTEDFCGAIIVDTVEAIASIAEGTSEIIEDSVQVGSGCFTANKKYMIVIDFTYTNAEHISDLELSWSSDAPVSFKILYVFL